MTDATVRDEEPTGSLVRLVTKWQPWLAGLPVMPILVLFGLNAVDEFDRTAFATLAPEIRRAFDLSNAQFGGIVGAAVIVVLLGGLPVGIVGDRFPRNRLVWGGAYIWAAMAIVTGLAPVVGILVASRIIGGVGKLVNEPVHNSLIADYYPPAVRGRAFAFHRMANPVGIIVGPVLAGVIGVLAGWRLTFVLLAIPSAALAVLAMRLLVEPLRGGTEAKELAEEAAQEPPVPFARARRTLFAVPTLKRFYTATFFAGGGVIAILPFIAIFLEDVYGVGALGRGIVAAGAGACQLLGTILGGATTDRIGYRRVGALARNAAFAVMAYGAALFLFAVSPVLPLSIAFFLLANVALGMYHAPNLAVQAMVIPARVRSTGFAFAAICLGLGAAVFAPMVGRVADAEGIRSALVQFTPLVFLAGLVYWSGTKHADGDAARAVEVLAGEAAVRRARLEKGDRPLLSCRGVDVSYGQVQVLFGVDFDVNEGELVALLGTNGAGKSTLLKAISGLVNPTGGAVFFEGRNITYHDGAETTALGIVQVPGGKGVFPSLTVAENLEVAGWLFRKDRAHLRRATDQVLEYFPVLRERWDQKAGNLSGGEQQMLTLAQAFIAEPRLLLIDELSLGLAPAIIEQLLAVVRAIHAKGTTVVVVEQSVNVALTLAARAVFLEKGEVRFSGPTADLLHRPDILRSVFLEGAASVMGVEAAAAPARVVDRTEVEADTPVLLEVRDLQKHFGGVHAVQEVSFELRRGEILGLIGPNGAGKTTVFDLVSGFVLPDRGSVVLEGVDVSDWSPDRRARARLGRSFQDARLFPSLTVADAIAVALERHVDVRDPVLIAAGLPVVTRSEQAVRARVEELIELLSLEAFRDKFVAELSTGTRRIVDIACSLAHDPVVLLLDEPSSGIAQRETEALGPLLRRVQEQLGCSLLVIEHDMPLVTTLAHRLLALETGTVIASGPPDVVVNHPTVVASYLGSDEAVIARSGAKASRRRTRAGAGTRTKAGNRA